jgi:hypothetical protein
MDEEKQRIKIAEVCGYKYSESHGWFKKDGVTYYLGYEDIISPQIPDFLNDLNAMHEAKQALWKKDWGYRYTFNDHLANIIKGRIVNRNEWDAETLLDATAEQQAEAFLRTLGLWEE